MGFGAGNGASEQMTIKAGNVGIGTTSPSYSLDVGNGTGAKYIRINGAASGDNNGAMFLVGNNSTQIGALGNPSAWWGGTFDNSMGIIASAGSAIKLYTNNVSTPRMIIDNSGNVGIGTTGPRVKLDVNGSIQLPDGYESGKLVIGNFGSYLSRQSSDGSTILQTGQAYLLLNPSVGNVGIGTASPAYDLDVGGGASGYDIRGYNVYTHDGGVHSFSDARLKNINGSYTRGLAEIMNLNPIFYTYKDDNPLGIETDNKTVGFVAQELQKQIPEAVGVGQSGYLTVTTTPILYAAINAIKEQQEQIIEHGTYNTKQDQDISKLLNDDLSISEKINIIGGSLDEMSTRLTSDETRLLTLEEGNKKQEARIKTLEEQMELIKTQNQAVIDFATALNMETLVYKDSLGNLDLGEGKITAADIEALGIVKAKEIQTEVLGITSEKTSGKAIILAGQREVIIKTPYASEQAKISLTPEGSTQGKVLYYEEIVEGESFKVKIDLPALEKDINFTWLIIK